MSRRARFLVLASAVVLPLAFELACGTPSLVQRREDELKTELAKAQSMGAKDCAPEELASAEANLDFGVLEEKSGDYIRAEDHFEMGFRMAKAAQRGVRNCKRAIIATPTSPKVIVFSTPSPSPSMTPLAVTTSAAPSPTKEVVVIVQTPVPTPTEAPTAVVIIVKETPTPTAAVIIVKETVTATVTLTPTPTPTPPPTPTATPTPTPEQLKYIVVDLTKKRIELKQMIHFQTGKSVILPDSFGILDEIAQVLKKPEHATMDVRIEGHTDSTGTPTFNLTLSKNRADAVRAYLMRAGVEGTRLRAVGLGQTTPIASNQTPDGRALNRRVEFHITKD